MGKKQLHWEVLEKMTALVTAGFGLVAALAWNEAIKKLFQQIFDAQSNLAAMFGYAALVTMIVVLLTVKLGQATSAIKEQLGDKPWGGEEPQEKK